PSSSSEAFCNGFVERIPVPLLLTATQFRSARRIFSPRAPVLKRLAKLVLKQSTESFAHQGVRPARLNSRQFRRIFSLHVFMTKTITKKMEVSGTKPEVAAPQDAKRRPLKTFALNGVFASVWAR